MTALTLELMSVLSEKRCEECGVILISKSDSSINLGAMNPSYNEVKKLTKELQELGVEDVKITAISADDWERWQDDSGAAVFTTEHQEIQEHIDAEAAKTEVNKPIKIENEDLADKNDGEKPQQGFVEMKLGDELDLIGTEAFFEDLEEEEDTIETITPEEGESSSDPIISAVTTVLANCKKLKASDIHIEPQEAGLRVRYRIDGILKEVYSLPKSRTKAIISRLKIVSKLDIAERRLPQDGRIRVNLNGSIEDFRVSTLPGKWGEKVVLRSLQSDPSILNLQKLITSEKELKLIRDLGQSPYGIMIVVGPTGSGKSTTLYSILSERNSPDVNISTVEDPVEYTLQGIHQVQVIREKGLDFARALRALMRQDPDIILVGETRDRETAQTAMEAALTGHMVFTTLHANDTATALTRLDEMGVPPYLVGASVVGVMAQRLVRKVCPSCSTTRKTEPGKDDLALSYGIQSVRVAHAINISSEKVQSGQACCTNCNGTGYKGRLGLYEVMSINDEMRGLILKHATADTIRECSKRQGMQSLLDYGMNLVKQQLTTLAEVERVCVIEEPEDV